MNRLLLILTTIQLTQALFSCDSKKPSKHEIGRSSDNVYLLTSVKTIQIDGEILPCTIQATYHPDSKEVFLISIEVKNGRIDTTAAYVTQFYYDQVRSIYAGDHSSKRNVAVYRFENDVLTDSTTAGFNIYDLSAFVTTQKELKQKIESQLKRD